MNALPPPSTSEPTGYPPPPPYQQPGYQQPGYQQPAYQQPAYQQQPYGSPPQYAGQPVAGGQYQGPPAGYYPPQQYAPIQPPANTRTGFAITSLVLGIVAIIFGIIPFTFFLAWILGAIGLIFGLLAWRRRMGKVSSVLNVIAIALGVVGVIIIATAVKHLNDDFGTTAGADGSGYHATVGTPSDDSLETNVPITIQNTSGKTCDFLVTVTANSTDGLTQLGSGTAFVNDVGAGQSASDSAGMLKKIPSGAVFKVSTVDKTCR